MIQRIQTLFLLGIILLSTLLFFVPFVEYNNGTTKTLVDLMPRHNANLNYLYFIPVAFNIINLLLSVLVIIQFKKRIIQIKMTSLLMAFSAILLGTMLLFDFIDTPNSTPIAKIYLPGSYLPIISILLAFLAIKFIKKDEDLVRSADRLR